jgi:integrase
MWATHSLARLLPFRNLLSVTRPLAQFIRTESSMPKKERITISEEPTQPYLKKGVATYYFGVQYFCKDRLERVGTRISTGETDKKRAKAKRDEIREMFIAELSIGQVEKSEVQSVESLIKEFLEHKRSSLTPKSYLNYEYDLRKFEQFAKGKPLRDVTPKFISDYLQTIKGRNTDPSRSSPAQQKAKRTLSVLFRYAVNEGRLENCVVDRVALKKVKKGTREYFTDSEFLEFWPQMPERTYAEYSLKNLTLLASATGARLSELASIEASHIREGKINLVNTKNGEPRSLTINERAQQAITRQRQAKQSHSVKAVQGSALLFPNERGGKLISDDRQTNPVSNRFRKVRESILPNRPGLHFHSLRHSFAQNAINAGVPEIKLSKYIGHQDLATTTRNYVLQADTDLESDERLSLREYIQSLQAIGQTPTSLILAVPSEKLPNRKQWSPLGLTISQSLAA